MHICETGLVVLNGLSLLQAFIYVRNWLKFVHVI